MDGPWLFAYFQLAFPTNIKVCHMSKLTQAASAIALAAATTTAFAWYAAPYQPPVPTQEQQQAMAEQQKVMAEQQRAMIEQQNKAMQQAFAAQQQFAKQQAEQFQKSQTQVPGPNSGSPFAEAPAFPEMPPMPEMGQYPSMPEMPKMPEVGQFPAMPEMPAAPAFEYPALPESVQARIKEMDAYREQAKQQREERRAAMKSWNEQRRAMNPHYGFGRPMAEGAPGMYPSVTPNALGAPAPQQQATAPAAKATVTQ